MKVLMMYAKHFGYKPSQKSLSDVLEVEQAAKIFENCVVAFIQVEAEDEEKPTLKVEKNLTKNLKWAARKNETNKIVLHSFAHLSDSKASAEYSNGYFLDLDIQAPGFSQARMFKSF